MMEDVSLWPGIVPRWRGIVPCPVHSDRLLQSLFRLQLSSLLVHTQRASCPSVRLSVFLLLSVWSCVMGSSQGRWVGGRTGTKQRRAILLHADPTGASTRFYGSSSAVGQRLRHLEDVGNVVQCGLAPTSRRPSFIRTPRWPLPLPYRLYTRVFVKSVYWTPPINGRQQLQQLRHQ